VPMDQGEAALEMVKNFIKRTLWFVCMMIRHEI
jgi:hypothetical protein